MLKRRAFVALTASAWCVGAAAHAGCALFPPPFGMSAGEASAFFSLSPRVVPERGYWEAPAFKKECSDLSESIAVVVAFYDGKPAALTFSGTVIGEKGLKDFDGFVTKYVGDPNASKEARMAPENNETRRAEWKKRGYGARYAVFPAGPEARGMYRAHLRLTSDAFAAVAERHYRAEEGVEEMPSEGF
ncbi:MAG: hypothetical protein ABW189_02850 [Rickettsiales bacterium]